MDFIRSFPHAADSFKHRKFQNLRKVYGWEGEGRFWALNGIIASSPQCQLRDNDGTLWDQISGELDMTVDALRSFIDFLASPDCRLLRRTGDAFTTQAVVDSLREKERRAASNRNYYRKTRQTRRSTDSKQGAGGHSPSSSSTRQQNATPTPSESTLPEPDGFALFWAAYPVKKSKKRALTTYARIVKKKPEMAAIILKGVNDYVRDHEESARTRRFTPHYQHPTTWLNGECWNDESSPLNHDERPQVSQSGRADDIVQ